MACVRQMTTCSGRGEMFWGNAGKVKVIFSMLAIVASQHQVCETADLEKIEKTASFNPFAAVSFFFFFFGLCPWYSYPCHSAISTLFFFICNLGLFCFRILGKKMILLPHCCR